MKIIIEKNLVSTYNPHLIFARVVVLDYTALDMLWHVRNSAWRPWRLVTTTSWLSINTPTQSRRHHMIGRARHRSGDIIMTSWHSWPPRPLTRLTLTVLHTDDSLVANILLFPGYLFLHMLFDVFLHWWFVAQCVRASLPGLCRTGRHSFDPIFCISTAHTIKAHTPPVGPLDFYVSSLPSLRPIMMGTEF